MEGLGLACTASMKTSELSSSTRQMLVVHMYFCSCTLLVVASLIAMVANSALCYEIYLYVVSNMYMHVWYFYNNDIYCLYT